MSKVAGSSFTSYNAALLASKCADLSQGASAEPYHLQVIKVRSEAVQNSQRTWTVKNTLYVFSVTSLSPHQSWDRIQPHYKSKLDKQKKMKEYPLSSCFFMYFLSILKNESRLSLKSSFLFRPN